MNGNKVPRVHAIMMDFMIRSDVRGAVRSAGVCADAQCGKIRIQKWLEELVSQSNTIQAQEDITQLGKIAGQDPAKLCVFV